MEMKLAKRFNKPIDFEFNKSYEFSRLGMIFEGRVLDERKEGKLWNSKRTKFKLIKIVPERITIKILKIKLNQSDSLLTTGDLIRTSYNELKYILLRSI